MSTRTAGAVRVASSKKYNAIDEIFVLTDA
jgi:hypothetical protein